jgi:hypothetical protein
MFLSLMFTAKMIKEINKKKVLETNLKVNVSGGRERKENFEEDFFYKGKWLFWTQFIMVISGSFLLFKKRRSRHFLKKPFSFVHLFYYFFFQNIRLTRK